MAHPGSLLKKKYLRTPIYSRPNPSERTGLLVAFSFSFLRLSQIRSLTFATGHHYFLVISKTHNLIVSLPGTIL
jgi:hypothetical protein